MVEMMTKRRPRKHHKRKKQPVLTEKQKEKLWIDMREKGFDLRTSIASPTKEPEVFNMKSFLQFAKLKVIHK